MSDSLFLVARVPQGGSFRLEGPEGRHAADVQRIRAGATVLLSDGAGAVATGVVIAAHRGALDLDITAWTTEPVPDPRMVVVQGIAKGDRGERAVQAMTEVGVDEIVPWAAARSVSVWKGDRGHRARERWQVTAREAAKQARRAWVPQITTGAADVPGDAPCATTAVVVELVLASAAAFVLHEEATERLASVPVPDHGDIFLVVGPEGGIDGGELSAFVAAGAVAVRLGQTVLRTSTAGVAALSVLSARLGRW